MKKMGKRGASQVKRETQLNCDDCGSAITRTRTWDEGGRSFVICKSCFFKRVEEAKRNPSSKASRQGVLPKHLRASDGPMSRTRLPGRHTWS